MVNNDELSPINEIESMPLDDALEGASGQKSEPPPAASMSTKQATPQSDANPAQERQSVQPTQTPQAQAVKTPETPSPNALFKSPTAQTAKPADTGSKAVIKRGNSRWLKLVIISLAILAIGGFAYFWFFYQVVVKIKPSETADKILLNGKEVTAGTFRLMPGKNIIEIIKDGYATYRLDREVKPGEDIDLNFSFIKQVQSTQVSDGAKSVQTSYDGKVCYFVSGDNRFMAAINNETGSAITTEVSVGSYKDPREYIISDDGLSGFILDKEALKVASFVKSDLINQTEAKLPPDAARISSFTTNRGSSGYEKIANSKIIYDLKSDYGWSLIYTDSAHKKSEIIMDLTDSNFTNLRLDWTDSPNKVLLVGGELGVLNLSDRSYKKLSDKTDFVSAKWGATGKYAVAQDASGQLFKISGESVEALGVSSQKGQYTWSDKDNLLYLDGDRLTKFNFDTLDKIIYAEVEGLKSATGLSVVGSVLYFVDSAGLKEAPLVENPYKEG